MTARHRTHIVVDVRMADAGGIGTYIRHIVPAIAALRPDWRFTVLGNGPRAEAIADASPNVALRNCRAPIYSVREQLALPLAAPSGADLFWTPHYNIPLAFRGAGKLMVTVHDVMHLALPEYTSSALRTMYSRTMFGAVRRNADAVVFDSEFSRAELLRLAGECRGRTEVVHLGVDDSWRCPTLESPIRRRPYLLHVGFMKPHKNLPALLRAFAQVATRIPHDLVIVGRREGLRTADATVEAEAAALGDRILFTGEITLPLLHTWVAGADALVQPSLYEGFGLPPLEAMAASCPCLVARAGSLPEVCGDAALYCDPSSVDDIAAGLLRITQDCALREDLRRRGREHAAQFTWDRCADRTVAIMDQVLGKA